MIRGGHNDRNTFASTYERAAAELTFNSRPLITSLSDIAYENRRFADIVGAILENRIRQVRAPLRFCSCATSDFLWT
jgi:hypothetical protein